MWFQKDKNPKSQNDEQLENLLKNYEVIFNSTEDAIFLIEVIEEKDFVYIQTNKSHQESTGITQEMIVNKTPRQLLGDDLGEIIVNNYRRCVEERKRVEYTETLALPAGLKTWKTTLTPVFENDKIIYIVGIAYDITQQENTIKELKSTNQKLNAILDASPDGIAIIDFLGNIKFASEKVAELVGLNKESAKDLIGKNFKEFVDQPTLEKLKQNLSILIQGSSFEKPNVYEINKVSGEKIFVEAKTSLLKDEQNQATGVLIIARDITERIKIEKEKERTQQIYQTLFENSPSGILLIDEKGIIVDANNAFLKLSGYPREHLIGQHCSILSKESDENKISDNIQRIFNGENLVHEVINIRKDGTPVHILLNERMIELQTGNKTILSISNDITELKEKERKLKESELLFKTLLDSSLDWTYLISDDMKIRYITPSVEKITGYSQKDFENDIALIIDIIHPEDRDYYISEHKIDDQGKYRLEEEHKSFIYRIITKNGSVKYINHVCSAIFDENGNFFGRRVTNRDITSFKRQTLEIQIQKERLENIIDGAKIGTWELNIQTGEVRCNNYWAEMIGYSLQELEPITTDKINSMLHPNDIEKVYSRIESHINGELDFLEVEFRMRHKNSNWVWIWDRGKLISRDKNGNPEWIIGMNIDITKQKEFELEINKTISDLQETRHILEDSLYERNQLIEELSQTKEKLEQINSEKDKFFSIIAHDLRSPLSSFVGLTKLISEEFEIFDTEELKEMVTEMKNSSSNVYKLLENLLEWSRLQRGVIRFEPETIDLADLIDQNIALQKEAANLKNITLTNLIDRQCFVEADMTMLNTVIRNLLSNAIKFTPRGGIINVGTLEQNEGDKIVVFVKDTGIGISKEDLEKIFRIEHKVNRPGTEGEPSSGLGLLLCKEFIEKHDGKIWIESELGKGTTFYFTMKKGNCY